MTKQIPVETYSRCVGYFRPVAQFNPGKQEEFYQRKTASTEKVKEAAYGKQTCNV